MPQNDHCNRMVLEVYFEAKEGQRITQWFEFRVADNRITVRPIEERADSGSDPRLRLGYNEITGFENSDGRPEQRGRAAEGSRRTVVGEPTSSHATEQCTSRPFDLEREESMVAPGCTRSQCIRCLDSRVKKPGGSRAHSTANLVPPRMDEGGRSAGTSSSTFPSDGKNDELSAARDDMVSEWLSSQLCLTRMKLKVILAFKKLVDTRNNELEGSSSSQAAAVTNARQRQ